MASQNGADYYGGPHERGSRRKKLAAMAGSVYRAGVAAATELKEQYNTRARGSDAPGYDISIPDSFPLVSIVTKGEEQLMLFPSYAKRHVRGSPNPRGYLQNMSASQINMSEEEYWRSEWDRVEDEKAVVDVDVRGWIYTPHRGPMTRRNRMLIGLARRLSGIPSPGSSSPDLAGLSSVEDNEHLKEEHNIAEKAKAIERRGQGEKEVANRGGYSEPSKEDDFDLDGVARSKFRSGSRTPASNPSSPTLSARIPWSTTPTELTEVELAAANANLMARLGPFLTTPLVQIPITMFFYNDEQSQSRTVTTNDSGHFSIRALLDFVPTHVRVLVNERISVTEPVQIIENTGVSIISDIDDTVKHSNISLGAREIFRNTFIRDLPDLAIEGVKEWYGLLHDMGVRVHYCSNSPWQLFPVIATFFRMAGLPPGSIHLKHYSGMLQGIFEPVAERKKGTLEQILRDFPQRRFLLVGDSGEADLEVYTDLTVANPGRILAIFIRDVTTPEQIGYFDASHNFKTKRRSKSSASKIRPEEVSDGGGTGRPSLPPRVASSPAQVGLTPLRPIMGNLIDFSEEPEVHPLDAQRLADGMTKPKLRSTASKAHLLSAKVPPPLPRKPLALRSTPSDLSLNSVAMTEPAGPAPQLPPRGLKLTPTKNNGNPPPPSQMQKPSENPKPGISSKPAPPPPPPPPPRRRGVPNSANPNRTGAASSPDNAELADFEALPGPAYVAVPLLASTPSPLATGGTTTPTDVVSKKVDLWRRRLARAQEVLGQHGVALYTWRRGEDVVAEAEGIVRQALEEQRRAR